MSESDKSTENTGNFVDQLRDIQGEYLVLSELYEKERVYGRKLAETMKLLQYEVDVTIPINKEYISLPEGTVPIKEAFMASESVVIMVDEQDNKVSRPLDRFPPDVILSIIQDCTPELKRLISERRRNTSIKVNALEKVLRELKKAQATFKQTKGNIEEESAEDEIATEVDEEEEQERRIPVAPTPKTGRIARDPKEEAFAFRASFLEKKEAGDNVGKA